MSFIRKKKEQDTQDREQLSNNEKVKKQRSRGDIGPLTKVMFYFKRLRDTAPIQKVISKERATVKARCGSDTGYAEYALKIRLIRKFLIVVLVLTVGFGAIFGAGRLDIDNIYYSAMDIWYMHSYSESSSGILNYTKAPISDDFALYKNGLVAASGSEIKIFNSTGRVTLTSGDIFATPTVVTSNKYVLVYDLGGNKFAIYNSFKKIETVTLDGSIAYASMSDGGGFVVVEKTQDYNSVVHIYDDNCNRISTYSTNEYVFSAEMSPNGKYTAVISASAENGEMTSTLTVLKQNKKKTYAQIDIGNLSPYTCKFISDNRIAVFCSDRVYVYNLKGKLKGEYMYPDSKLAYISHTDGGVALLFEDDLINGQNTLVVLNKNGKSVYSGQMSGSFTDMEMYDNYVFLLTNNGIRKFNYKSKITTFKEGSGTFGELLVCSKDKVLLCTDSRGIYFDME